VITVMTAVLCLLAVGFGVAVHVACVRPVVDVLLADVRRPDDDREAQ
jgi:hypothetical protein